MRSQLLTLSKAIQNPLPAFWEGKVYFFEGKNCGFSTDEESNIDKGNHTD